MTKIPCPKCHGTGVDEFYEDDHLVQDACYHCCTMGTIEVDDEEYVAYVNDLILEVC